MLRFLALVIALSLTVPAATAQVVVPACPAFVSWVAPHPVRPPAGLSGGGAAEMQAWTQERNRIFDQLFSDTTTASVFGQSFQSWSDADLRSVRFAMGTCQAEANAARRNDEATRLMLVLQHMNTRLRGPTSTVGRAAPGGTQGATTTSAGCASVYAWASGVLSRDQLNDLARAQGRQLDMAAIRKREEAALLADPATKAAFGLEISRWTQFDFQAARDRIDRCRLAARSGPNAADETRLEVGRAAVMRHWTSRG